MIASVGPKRVLVVAYLFPPVGGAGVQRAAKFAKYLPMHGWTASVLTVSNPSVPVFDESLNEDIPEDAVIRYARTLEPGYGLKKVVLAGQEQKNAKPSRMKTWLKKLIRDSSNMILQPDSQILWWPDAVKQGMRLLNEIHHDAILVTAPPFSSFLVGATLSRRSGLPLVLDYRDEWGISNAYWENKQRQPLSRWLQASMQRKVVRTADVLIATTRSSADSLARIAEQADSRARVTHIYNGYDAADFESTSHDQSYACFRLAYVGTLWNLTSVEPLVRGLEQLSTDAPDLAERLEVVFAGRRTGPQDRLIDRVEDLPCRVHRRSYVEHQGAIELMQSSDSLCVLLADVPQADRVVPAKIFEYMAARKPILAIVPDGEVSGILADCPYATVCCPSDTGRIARTLAELIERHGVRLRDEHERWNPAEYERRNLARALAEILDSVSSPTSAEPVKPLVGVQMDSHGEGLECIHSSR